VRLRPLYSDSLGDTYPAEGWIDLGLTEHLGEPAEVQRASIQRDKLPDCSGCLCSVAALNAAGCTGPPTKEIPVFFEQRVPEQREVWDRSTPDSAASRRAAEERAADFCTSPQGAGGGALVLPAVALMQPPEPPPPAPTTALLPPLPEPVALSGSRTSLAADAACAYSPWTTDEASGADIGTDTMASVGPVVPGICGTPRALAGDVLQNEAPLYVEWSPPTSAGGCSTVVAYRLLLRPLFYDGLGEAYPAESSIDLGLVVHQGGPTEMQNTSVQCDKLPPCPGCLCSVAALNAAGITGLSTEEVPVFFDTQVDARDLWDLGTPNSMTSRFVTEERAAELGTDVLGFLPSEPAAGTLPGPALREQVFLARQAQQVQDPRLQLQPWEAEPYSPELPPPPRASPAAAAGGGGGPPGALRALQHPGTTVGGGMTLGGPERLEASFRSVASRVRNFATTDTSQRSGIPGPVRIQTLQSLSSQPPGSTAPSVAPGAAQQLLRPCPATFGMGPRGALVAGRPRPGAA